MSYLIRNIELKDIDRVKDFTDKWIGKDYFTKAGLRDTLLRGIEGDLNASFLALDQDKIIGVRITLLPGHWKDLEEISAHLCPHLWKVSAKRVAYFKSLFIDKDYQFKGVAKELNIRSMEVLYKLETQAIVTHAWVESPEDSSRKYLTRSKFESVIQHKNFWFFKNYLCTRCAPDNCRCTAEEMIYYFPILDDDDEEEIIQGTR